ncbi:T-complex protein 1 [Auriculariales sp. MPI-PUGE-AT-0066]|nr:T-complex protein 1 [Auriculariales sp. MPI-PUGE-AT-0066]
MSLKVPKANNIQLFKEGSKHLQGLEDAVLRNIQAVAELSDLVRTSFGPNGRSKLVINHLGKLFVTTDAATIIRELEVVHPAAKLLVMASQAQEQEMGDATNLVLILAGELLKKAESLLVMGLHPSDVIQGYELAGAKAQEVLTSKLKSQELEKPLTQAGLEKTLRPVLAAKQYGYEDILARLVSEAALTVMPSNTANFNVDNVRVVKILGSSLPQSRVIKGMVFNREPEGVVKQARNAKVAVFTCAIDISQTETKGTMLNFTRGEEKHMEQIYKEIADSGVKVIVAGNSVGDLALHYLDRLQIAVVKVLSKFDLRRLCRVVNATPLARLGAPTLEEMGWADIVETTEIGGDRVTVFRQDESGDSHERTRTATVLLRGATANLLDDLERAVDDGVSVLKALIKDARLVPGAGATEMALSRAVAAYGAELRGLSQHSARQYAAALEVIPRTLAENAGARDATEVLTRLRTLHDAAGGEVHGVDIEGEEDGTLDAVKHNIVDSLAAKSWALKLATEAAVAVLKVDSIIMSKPAGGPKIPQQSGSWDED